MVVDPRQRRLLWVPRDLWCSTLGGRINTSFAQGGHAALTAALAEHEVFVDHSSCLRRARYKALDPEARWQPGIGYDYLTDDAGLRLRRAPRRRGFVEGCATHVA